MNEAMKSTEPRVQTIEHTDADRQLTEWLNELNRLESLIDSKYGRIQSEYVINSEHASYQFYYYEAYNDYRNARDIWIEVSIWGQPKANGDMYHGKTEDRLPVMPMSQPDFEGWCKSFVKEREA